MSPYAILLPDTSGMALFAYAVPFAFVALGVLLSHRPKLTRRLAPLLLGISAAFVLAIYLWMGPSVSPLLGIDDLGFSARLDVLSVAMLMLIALLGAVVLSFSFGYLDGDPRVGLFLKLIAQTLAAVGLLVSAGNLYQLVFGWVAMSLLLHRLLMFRRDRPFAVLAAKKKFVLARTGDLALIAAALLLVRQTGSAELHVIAQSVQLSSQVPVAALSLIALTAVLKSAQFPSHGWLVEVMEVPTPVSALLHAGIVNSGGFLLLRFADLFANAPVIGLVIALLGACTAILASAMMLAQNQVKATLAYSTVAQMGFMLLQCGLGAYASALIHILGHSLYKAHAFLSSGTAVDAMRADGWAQTMGNASWIRSLAIVLVLVVAGSAVASLVGLDVRAEPVTALFGYVFCLGLALLLDAGAQRLRVYGALVGVGLLYTATFVAVQRSGLMAFGAQLPHVSLSPAGFALLIVFAVFATVLVLLQGMSRRGWLATAYAHLAQGLYLNTWINGRLGAFRHAAARSSTS
ncbi:MAG: proton-conducting transporter membrane subunit [Pseudomonadota bacterium]